MADKLHFLHLSLISKIIERFVIVRLTDHLSSNKLLNPYQSAYCKHHSTETGLESLDLSVHNVVCRQHTDGDLTKEMK